MSLNFPLNQPAPAFFCPGPARQYCTLDSLRGRPVVLYFLPQSHDARLHRTRPAVSATTAMNLQV